jgi:acyl-CoA reductase-like NAD-dependent aldehyde dehydrogenase
LAGRLNGGRPLAVGARRGASAKTSNCAINGAYFSTGQRCNASSRLIVTAGIHDRFVDAMVARLKTLVVGDVRRAGTVIGPVVDAAQLKQSARTDASAPP